MYDTQMRACAGTGLGGLVASAAQWAAGNVTSGVRVASYGSGMSTVVTNLVAKVSQQLQHLTVMTTGGYL